MSNCSVSAFASLRGYHVIRPAELCIILVKKSTVAFKASEVGTIEAKFKKFF